MLTHQTTRLFLFLAPFFLLLILSLGACRPGEETRPAATPAATATPTPIFTPRPSPSPVLSPVPSATPAAAAHPAVIYDPTNGTFSGSFIYKSSKGELKVPF